jgi:tetratricopeptide (TPR) repeat protein
MKPIRLKHSYRRRRSRRGCLPLLALCGLLAGAALTRVQPPSTAAAVVPPAVSATPLPTTVTPTAAPAPTGLPTPNAASRYPQLIQALQAGRIEDAIAVLQAIPNPQPEDVKPLSMGVRLMLDHLYVVDATDFQMPTVKAKMDAALDLADRAIQADPQAADGWAAKALALNWAYRSDEVFATIGYALYLSPNSPTVQAVQAEIEVERRHYDAARALLDAVIGSAQHNLSALARAYYVRGNMEQILGHAQAAIDAYEAAWAISAMPYDASDPWRVVPPGYILYQLGPLYLFQDKSDLALKEYTAALAVDRQDAFLYYLRGRVYRFNGQRAEAEAEFRRCVLMDARQWRCWRNLGQLAYEGGQWAAAVQAIQPIVDDNSQISDDYYYLGAAAIELNQCGKARPLLEHGLERVQTATGSPHWTADDFTAALRRC